MRVGEGDLLPGLGLEERLRAVVLVEGASDRCAVEAWARRCGRDLVAERVAVVAMGGATNIGRYLEHLGPHGRDLQLAGMCDAGEQGHFLRALARAGLGCDLTTRRDMERLGFYVCVDDLEDELVRAAGVDRVEQTIAAQGELASFRVLQKQPAQRGRSVEHQLRRFFGGRSGHKALYARLLVEALDADRAPRLLRRLLARV